MAINLETLLIPVVADTSSLKKSLKAAQAQMGGFAGGLAKVGGAVVGLGLAAGAAAITGIAAATIKFTGLSSEMSEQVAKSGQVFLDWGEDVTHWSDTMSTSFGISKLEALEFSGNFGNIIRNMGVGQERTAEMSMSLVELAADQAAFNNLPTEDVLGKIESAMVGQFKGVRALGIVIDKTMVKEKAREMGLASATGEIDKAALAEATYALIVEQSGTALGQFARESDGLAAVQKVNTAVFQDLKVKLGNELLPAITNITKKFGEFMADPAIQQRIIDFAAKIGEFADKVVEKIPEIIEWFQKIPTWLEENRPIVIGVLVALGAAVIAFAISVIIAMAPVILATLAMIAPFLLVAAAVAFVVAVIENDFGGVRTWLIKAVSDITNFFKILGNYLSAALAPRIKRITDGFNGIKRAIGWVVTQVKNVISWFGRIRVPAIFRPGSPTPFEMGLRGINKQLKIASKSELPNMMSKLDMNANFGTSGTSQTKSNNDKLINAINNSKQKIDYVKMATVFRDTVLRENT